MSNVAVPTVPQSRTSNGAAASGDRQGAKLGHQRINKVAVLGAGTMGARIAAHFANAGVPCVLLDIVTPDAAQSTDSAQIKDKTARRKLVASGLDAAVKSKPAAFFEKGLERLITIGTFDDDIKLLADVDWIIEAVAENLEIK
ncbi:MAG TPA: 3-hydroxyacyl-CoA dehydrogenase NAD-binding domain-containing protein, partial [Candidatus Angelobacter sp.]